MVEIGGIVKMFDKLKILCIFGFDPLAKYDIKNFKLKLQLDSYWDQIKCTDETAQFYFPKKKKTNNK